LCACVYVYVCAYTHTHTHTTAYQKRNEVMTAELEEAEEDIRLLREELKAVFGVLGSGFSLRFRLLREELTVVCTF
jgi:hypothetical protein